MNQPLKKKGLSGNSLLDDAIQDEGLFLEPEPPREEILGDEERFIVKDEPRQRRIADLTRLYRERNDLVARNEIIQINMGLVGKVIRRYLPIAEGMGITLKDLENVGVIGLMKAIERYEPERAAFSTYALDWIWNEVQRHLQAHGAPMRLPSQLARILPSIYRTLQQLEQQEGRSITLHQASSFAQEIADRINATVEDVQKCIRYAPRRHDLQGFNEDDQFNDDELMSQASADYGDLSDQDTRMDHTLATLEDEEATALVQLWLAQLPSADMRTVICHTFGLGGMEVLPFQRLTQVMRMSPGQIKVLREEALEIMRALARRHALAMGD
ncbi:MAG: sigma-70 family RNA polymerase sigma factor [Marinospirillum sp.]|uniref:sigma-70 family RNA polymerase sigma factor n=1 Tax=Marinospirillum sp. TaxID=2183934 RepID=UPI0019F10498|nr:sigma-70 family RNA polymerase sigma factor [Marinospirillum sp.]MBE0506062.1 sigma-70 family RNA polymerase sigma factor [Marinospirillum sp.]